MGSDSAQLPISPYLDNLTRTFAAENLLLLSAETGAGKTTLFPLALLAHPQFSQSKILLLEPRRLAARAAAQRIAALLKEKLGQTVGLRTRLETAVGKTTRLEVVTEGVLTRLLQHDPSLAGYGTILFDEFHTRTLQGDLGLALAWDARRLFRPDLRIAVLSATLPVKAMQDRFGAWPHAEVPGRAHPVRVLYRPAASPRETPWDGVNRLAREALEALRPRGGTVLCFLPGYREMHRAAGLLASSPLPLPAEVLLLHGRMAPELQRAILDPAFADASRVILATNVAETSLTIPGVLAVVDAGLERRVRFSPRTGMDHWETVPISQASAEQRRGRAGRTAPGVCYRWWAEHERREAFSAPEIAEADLAGLTLETALWGAASPAELAWLTPPPAPALQQAAAMLEELGLFGPDQKITPLGREAAGLAVHPRLAKMLLSARRENLTSTAAVLAAILENGEALADSGTDVRERLQALRGSIPGADRLLEDADRLLRQAGSPDRAADADWDEDAAGLLLLAAYPDRAAKRTRQDDSGTSRYLLASGRGALIKGPLAREEYLAVADLDGGERDARIFLAAPIRREDLEAGRAGQPKEGWNLDWQDWKPRAKRTLALGALILREHADSAPPARALQTAAFARLRSEGVEALPWNDHGRRLLARCRFVERWGGRTDWPRFGAADLLASAEDWLTPFGDWAGGPIWDGAGIALALETRLGRELRQVLDACAPETYTLPSGSNKKLDYTSGEAPMISARLQEFFGCVTTPRVCGRPLLLDLLSPAGRTMQKTSDLDGFWNRAYQEIRKELSGRYPRHPWPEDPRAAKPTSRAKPRKR